MSFDTEPTRPKRNFEKEAAELNSTRSRLNLLTGLAAACCLLGVATFAVGNDALAIADDQAVQIIGYIIGSLAPLVLVASARRVGAKWEVQSGTALTAGLKSLMLSIVLISIVTAGLHAYLFARHV